jgi:hypothetical protein
MAQQDIEARLKVWLKQLNEELDRRQAMTAKLDRYHSGYPDAPDHVKQIRLEPEYRVLMRQAVTNWPELIVDSREERLEVVSFDFGGGSRANDDVWQLWQRAGLDADAGMVHESALTDGRAYVIVWTDGREGVEITPEHAEACVVAYEMPSRRRRAAALRRWTDGDRWYCTLYLPDGLYKFQTDDEKTATKKPKVEMWERREIDGEEWPLPNPLGVVPVVEFAVNRSLKPLRCSADPLAGKPQRQDRQFGTAAGEFERALPNIDRINTTVFAGLLAQAWSSFPVRALIGDKIQYRKRTDSAGAVVTDGNDKPIMDPVEPFQVAINRLIQIENPDGKLVQLPEAKLDNYSKAAEVHVRHLAAITKTPAHYLLGEMVNLSADAIRAAEAALISKVRKHHRALGESWEEVMRLALDVLDDPRAENSNAETQWKDPESRSMAERADAASKLKDIVPRQAIWEYVLQATPQEIARWESQEAFDALLAPPEPEPEPEAQPETEAA